jgi:hypothetical protein
MKNQNDMIWSIVAIVLTLIIAGVCFGTKREPVAPTPPTPVNVATPQYPTSTVVMDNKLGGTDNQAAGGGGGGGRGASGLPGPAGGGPGLPSASQGIPK